MSAVLAAACAGPGFARDEKGVKLIEEPTCGEYGTSVQFEKSPKAAATKALKEEKLVFVLHISGHFEDSGLT
jgi:hypothetical protein